MNLRSIFLFLSLAPSAYLAAEPFAEWWESYKQKFPVPADLVPMVDYYTHSQLSEFTSNFWEYLNRINIDQISTSGYLNFKQTVACNYFTFIVPVESTYSSNLTRYSIPVPLSEIEKKHDLLSLENSVQYNTITAKYLQYAIENGWESYLDHLEEPALGNPPAITYRGKRISQDILNSLSEYIPILRSIEGKVETVAEVGAGSGRTAYCFLKLHPGIKYYIIDIPPALYLSQKYLTDLFPEKMIFPFKPYAVPAECREDIEAAELIFLTPDQMECIPSDSVDLFLAIDCLHEMKPSAIQHFLDQAQRTARYFYTKNWMNTHVDSYTYNWYSYPIPETWSLLFDEPCFVPSVFFHSLYQIR